VGIFLRGQNKGAYQGRLTCPYAECASSAIRFVENITPFRQRYRCRKCGRPFQYETGAEMFAHPYAPFKKNKWRDIVDLSKGRETQKGETK